MDFGNDYIFICYHFIILYIVCKVASIALYSSMYLFFVLFFK